MELAAQERGELPLTGKSPSLAAAGQTFVLHWAGAGQDSQYGHIQLCVSIFYTCELLVFVPIESKNLD